MDIASIGIALLIGICISGFYVTNEMLEKILNAMEEKQKK